MRTWQLTARNRLALLVAVAFVVSALGGVASLSSIVNGKSTASWTDDFSDLSSLESCANVDTSSPGIITALPGSDTWTQEDWSGGPGQKSWGAGDRYWKEDGSEEGRPPYERVLETDAEGHLKLRDATEPDSWSKVEEVTVPRTGGNIVAPGDGRVYLMNPCGTGHVYDIDGEDPDDIWAVGSGAWSGYPVAHHWNGEEWSSNSLSAVMNGGSVWGGYLSPDQEFSKTHVTGVYVVSSTEVWAVGTTGETWSVEHPGRNAGHTINVLRYDGQDWEIEFAVDREATMPAIDGSGPDDIWITGGPTALYHYDGNEWTPVDPLPGNDGVNGFDDVEVVSPDEAYGFLAVDKEAEDHSYLCAYDGETWSVLVEGATALINESIGFVAYDIDNIYLAASLSGDWEFRIRRYNDTLGDWEAVFTPADPSLDLYAMDGSGPSDLYAAGTGYGGPAIYGQYVVNYDGEDWSQERITTHMGHPYCVHATSPSDVWVGQQFVTDLGFGGSILHCEGTRWDYSYDNRLNQSFSYVPQTTNVQKIADIPGESYMRSYVAAEDEGTHKIFSFGLSLDTSDPAGALFDIFAYDTDTDTWESRGSPESDYLQYSYNVPGLPTPYNLAPANGTIYLVGGLAQRWPEGNDDYLCLEGIDSGQVWALGEENIFFYDGQGWSKQYQPPDGSGPGGIRALAIDDVYALYDQYLYHFNGSEWSMVHDFDGDLPPDEYLRSSGECSLEVLDANHVIVAITTTYWDGSANRERIRAFTYDGSAASQLGEPLEYASVRGFFGPYDPLGAAADDDIWMSVSCRDPETQLLYSCVYRWNGITWTEYSDDLAFNDIAMISPVEGYAVGGIPSLAPDGPHIFRWDGSDWVGVDAGGISGIDDYYHQVDCRLTGEAYFYDTQVGDIFKYNGSTWSGPIAATFDDLRATINSYSTSGSMWGDGYHSAFLPLDDNSIFLGGADESSAHWDGNCWTTLSGPGVINRSYDIASNSWNDNCQPIPVLGLNGYDGYLVVSWAKGGIDGRIYFFAPGNPENECIAAYDPLTDSWERDENHGGSLASPPASFNDPTTSIGHFVQSDDLTEALFMSEPWDGVNRRIIAYDIEHNSWEERVISDGPSRSFGLAYMDSGSNIYLFGGTDEENGKVERDVYMWNYDTLLHTPGQVDSSVYDTGNSDPAYTGASWIAEEPSETNVSVMARTGTSPEPDVEPGGWTGWATLENEEPLPQALDGKRYLQYRVDMSTSTENSVPRLDQISFDYGPPPGTILSVPITPQQLESWDEATFKADTPGRSRVILRVRDQEKHLIPDSVLPGNSAGFLDSPLNLAELDPEVYPSIRLEATLVSSGDDVSSITSWGASWILQEPEPPEPEPPEPPEPDEKVLGSTRWCLAEGSTGGGFDTWILIQNPQEEATEVEMTFITHEGPREPVTLRMGPESRATVRIANYVPNDWHVATMIESGLPVVAERSMYWDKNLMGESDLLGGPQPYEMKGGHANLGVPLESSTATGRSKKGARKTYFPEGATAGGFDTWILLCNVGKEESEARVSLMTEKGLAMEKTVTIPSLSRQTVHLDDYLPDAFHIATEVESDSFIVAERSMYWDPDEAFLEAYQMIGGHSNDGSPAASKEWFLAEGSTGAGFDTYILIQNPQTDEARVNVTFMDATGVAAEQDLLMPARSRATIRALDHVPDNWHVATHVTADGPVVAERSMYWDRRTQGEPFNMREGHSTVGVTGTGSTWMVPEGSTGAGFDSWVLIVNPDDEEASARVTFMTREGPREPVEIAIKPNSRHTLHVNQYVDNEFHVSTMVESEAGLVVERAMYWDRKEHPGIQPHEMMGGHSSVGVDP